MTPPVPGTAAWTGLASGDLPVQAALGFLIPDGETPEAGTVGGTCVFLGTTRRWTRGFETPSLSFEAYAEMASAELARLAESARVRWGLTRVVLLHRLGDVPSPEASVLCAASSPHRAPAFEACRWLIDTLKKDVPIWKQERWPDGGTAWVDPASGANPPSPSAPDP